MVQNAELRQVISSLIEAEGLPSAFSDTVEQWYRPLAGEIAKHYNGQTLVLGVQGTQGSGKSTLAAFLNLLLQAEHGLATVSLSLDDFYLTLAERQALAKTTHPLLQTRGVPGTHDVQLAIDTIESLKRLGEGESFAIPRFDKSMDDRAAESRWDSVTGPISVVIFEGWCVGCDELEESSLLEPLNELERVEDSDGEWRAFISEQLSREYKALYALNDKLVVLQAPSFECVLEWRMLQEQKLKEKLLSQGLELPDTVMSEAQIRRFISHYERLTRHCLNTLPDKADWLLPLDQHHTILGLVTK